MSKPRPPLEYFADDAGGALMQTCIAFIVFESLAMMAYFTSRWISPSSGPKASAYMMGLGYMSCMGLCVQSYRICKVGGHEHIETMPLWILTAHLKKNKVIEWLYLPSVTFPKLAILLVYTRVFTQNSRFLRYLAYGTGTSMVLLLTFGVWAPYMICQPFAYNWDKTIEGGECGDILMAYRWISFPNILTDLVLMSMCLPAVWTMRLKPALRISLLITFAIGNIGIIISIIRFAIFFHFNSFKDYTYNGSKALTWTVVEPGVYFITACLITMRPLLRRALQEFPSLLPYFRSGSTKTKTHRSKESSEGVKVHREMKIAYECDDTRKDFDKEGFLKLDDGDEKTISENKKEEKTISENKKDERGDLEKDISI